MAKNIHVIKDESLGGVKREYIEVDRKAEVGEWVVITHSEVDGYAVGDLFEVTSVYDITIGFIDNDEDINHAGHSEYKTLEPTDILHIDGERYRMVDRKAKVGERVIVTNTNGGWYTDKLGELFTVIDGQSYGFSLEYLFDEVFVETDENSPGLICSISNGDYRVLVPADSELSAPKPPQSQDDIIANLVRRVSELEQQTTELEKDNERQAIKIDDLEQYCGGLKGDIETWAQEVETLRYTNTELYSRLGHVEQDMDDLDEKVEMCIDDIVTLDERTNLLQEITINVAEFVKLIGGAR